MDAPGGAPPRRRARGGAVSRQDETRTTETDAALFEAAPAPLCLLGPDGRLRRANRAFREALGRPAAALEGAALADLAADPAEAEAALARLAALAAPGAPETAGFDLRCPGADGRPRPTRWTLRRLPDGAALAEMRDETVRRRRLRLEDAMAAATGAGVWELERDGLGMTWSRQVFEIFGRDPAEGVPTLDATIAHYAPEERERVEAAVAALVEDGRPFDFEAGIRRADGARRRVRVTGHSAAPQGEAGRFFGTIVDVTEDAARRDHLRLLSAVSERTRNSVFITDRERRIVWVNPAFERLSGYRLEEVRGSRPRVTLRDPSNAPETFAAIDAAIEAGGAAGFELLNRTRSGEARWVSVDVQNLPGPDGAPDGIITVETDITALKAVEARAREAEAAAVRARERLEDAVEAVPDGFALWDAEDRLVLCNARYREMYAASAEAMVPGVRFEDVLRFGLARGQYADAIGREEAWLAERLRHHLSDSAELDQHLGDGRWLRVMERRTPEGGRVGLRVDITERKRQEAELKAKNEALAAALAARDAAEARFRDIVEISSDWVWEQDAELRFTYISPGFARSTGADPRNHMGRTRADLIRERPELRDGADWDALEAKIAAREPFSDFVYRAYGVEGEYWVRISGAPYHDAEGRFAGYRGTGADVTALHRAAADARAAQRALAATLDAVPDALIEASLCGRVSAVRPGRGPAAAVVSPPPEGAAPLERVLPEDLAAAARGALAEAAAAGGPATREARRDGPGGPRWYALTAAPKDATGARGPAALILLVRDVTDYKRAERELRRAALSDPLTGLPNRRGLTDHLGRLAADADRTLAVMHVDLDRFKAVNDTLGHAAGDHVLLEAARLLRDETRADDLVARVGGDEFVVVVRGADPGGEAAEAAERLTRRLSEPMAFGEITCRIGASVGIALWRPSAQPDPERVLADADIALYEAKRAGRGRWRRFEPWMRRRAETAATLGQEIRAGLERDEFEAWLQPQVGLLDGRPRGFEALIRWRHPTRGLLRPDRFLFAAAEANLVARLDDRMMELAADALARLRAAGVPAPRVSVNVSADRLADPEVVDRVKWAVDAAGLSPSDFALEIVESVLLDETARRGGEAVRRLAAAGFAIELDDFGTGHAAISTLRALPVDRIKIDGGFVRGVDRDPELRTMAGAIVALGGNLGLEVVAEGVERDAERDVMAELGCAVAQGNLIGRPMPWPDVVAWHAAREARAPERDEPELCGRL
jgi:diguanylate cyclase (GGDEF)-like protein/PAS domain S-box-containing protein